MSAENDLDSRVRAALQGVEAVREVKMFGGVGFMVNGNLVAAASKRGLLGMAHAIRLEEKQNKIRTSVICPGLVDTELLEKRPVRPTPEILARAAARPLRTIGPGCTRPMVRCATGFPPGLHR